MKHLISVLISVGILMTVQVSQADESRTINQESKDAAAAPEYVNEVNTEKAEQDDAQAKQEQRKHKRLVERAASRR
ncbi:MAG: hypothetical protein IT289_00580 [Oligoflexia bacterium]|nr:hypothetical protein [Oligoflexia bacterium]